MRDPFAMFCFGAAYGVIIAGLDLATDIPRGLIAIIVLVTWAPIVSYYHGPARRNRHQEEEQP